MHSEEPDVKIRLLQAAKKLFAKQGYDGTSVRQICDEAGANVALVSYYFGGKENVFLALFENFFPIGQIEELAKKPSDPVQGVKDIIRGVTEFRMLEPYMVQLLQQEILFNTPRIDVLRKMSFPLWKHLREMLQQGREQGLFRFRSLNNTLMTVLGVIMFHKQTEYFAPILEPEVMDIEALIADMNDFVLSGLHYKLDKNG
ncbi:TetR family transcriptional regulator [Paenibacillus nasutitermitis]|uniref:TetR family transcriptional regulator n=1 Tax=Paenibacillus nasutitermitis TaxID=1652958 RepID=A0A916ZKQ0_9BACL|nr:TetR family transcriptional regulator [Paenibacillus nasutitermitis]GGE01828.1 TetR family transcriptional regulator [Paenibacillus nasutitermitis]